MRRGLVIGKFYPPHKGHKYLIDFAAQRVDHLVVVVCDRSDQEVSGKLRAQWLRTIHPNVQVIVVDDILKDEDSQAWAEYTEQFLSYTPDVVFTSENYGENYARFLQCEHVLVDKARAVVPISSTQIRANPLKCWGYLEPCVRGYFAKRVCVIGAESTGTTTMTEALADHYKTKWVAEYGREYWEKLKSLSENLKWDTKEFILIAEEQNRREDQLAQECHKVLFCDTDSFATSIWHERYMGFHSPEVQKVSEGRRYDLYLLTDTDIPFVQDGTRDGERIRHWMHTKFEEELKKHNKNYLLLSGAHEDRLKKAIQACNEVLGKF